MREAGQPPAEIMPDATVMVFEVPPLVRIKPQGHCPVCGLTDYIETPHRYTPEEWGSIPRLARANLIRHIGSEAVRDYLSRHPEMDIEKMQDALEKYHYHLDLKGADLAPLAAPGTLSPLNLLVPAAAALGILGARFCGGLGQPPCPGGDPPSGGLRYQAPGGRLLPPGGYRAPGAPLPLPPPLPPPAGIRPGTGPQAFFQTGPQPGQPGSGVWSPGNPTPLIPPPPGGPRYNGTYGPLPSPEQMGYPPLTPTPPTTPTPQTVRIWSGPGSMFGDVTAARRRGLVIGPGGRPDYISPDGSNGRATLAGLLAVGAIVAGGMVALDVVALSSAYTATLPAGAPAGSYWVQIGNSIWQLVGPAAPTAPLLLSPALPR